MAKKRKRKLPVKLIWTLIILFAITYLIFYTVQRQRVLRLDNFNQTKRDRINNLLQETASKKEREQQLSLSDVKKNAELQLGMKQQGDNSLPDPKIWEGNK